MAQHRSSHSFSERVPTDPRSRWVDPRVDDAITEVIPFNEFGKLDDLDFREHCEFDTGADVLGAPELDDLHEAHDPTPLRLAVPVVPAEFRAAPPAPDDSVTDIYEIADFPDRRGLHRKDVAGTNAVKGRLLIAAMATGAAAAAAHSAVSTPDVENNPTVLAADESLMTGTDAPIGTGVQVITVAPAVSSSLHTEELAKGVAFAQERAEREARLQRPLFVMPTKGINTSAFGYRWGVLHAGIDIANSIGTPIYAAGDGVVVDAGPTAGYGAWVKVRHNDGTVTLYGHVNTWLVNIGQRVMAGDQIATMGNRGNSTGPHLHFEVLINGTDRIDPVPWLAKRGIRIGGFSG